MGEQFCYLHVCICKLINPYVVLCIDMPDRKYYVIKSRYYKKYYETHRRVTLTLKKEDYEKLDKIARVTT